MKRIVLALALLAFCASAFAQGLPARSGEWPSRPIHMIVPYPAGSSPDLIARMLNDKLGAALGQPVIVENRPGAGGNLGTNLAAKAPPDGYTICLSIGGPLAVNTVLYSKLEYDPFKDLAPITLVAFSPNVLVVDPKLGVNSLKEFIALAKSQPGKLNYGSVGSGTASHLTMEMLKGLAGIDIVHVPYPGSPQVNTAILSGQIAGGFVVPATAMPLVQSGRLKAIAVTTVTRTQVLPDVPTVAEAGFPRFQAIAWQGIVAPAGTPRPIIERLYRELSRILKSEEVHKRMLAVYFQAVGGSPQELSTLMHEEVERWGAIIKRTGARAD